MAAIFIPPRITQANSLPLVLEAGEIVFDTDLNALFVGDGVTPGGNVIGIGELGGVEVQANKGMANGYAPLDADARIPASAVPESVIDAIDAKAAANNVLALDNTTAYTPTADYHPSTKKYVDLHSQGSNLLINGNFAINQRGYVSGTATTAANQFTLDRWFIPTSGQSLTFTSNENGNTVTAPASGISQIIEACNVKDGTYTLSWTGTATAMINSTEIANGESITLSANSNVTVKFASGTVYGAKLELGSSATSFISRTFEEELNKCKRYYCKTYSYSTGSGALTSSGSVGGITSAAGVAVVIFEVIKRLMQ